MVFGAIATVAILSVPLHGQRVQTLRPPAVRATTGARPRILSASRSLHELGHRQNLLRKLQGRSTTAEVLREEAPPSQPTLDAYEAALRLSIENEESSSSSPSAQSQQLQAQQEQQLDFSSPSSVQNFERTAKKARGKQPEMWVEGDSTEVTNVQRATTIAVWGLSAILLADAFKYISLSASAIDPVIALLVASFTMLFADFFSGIFHWSVDNYGDINTPIMGSIIHSFQGHHSAPWTITHRPFFNNVYKIALPCLFLLSMAAVSTFGSGLWGWEIAAVVFFNMQILGQEFHKLSHMIKTPPAISKMQQLGILLSKRKHLAHHTPPFDGSYCIVTGHMNGILDNTNFFRRLEKTVYKLTGAEPNCWKLKPELKEKVVVTKLKHTASVFVCPTGVRSSWHGFFGFYRSVLKKIGIYFQK